MKLLMVDDESIMLEMLKKQIDWISLEIDEVFIASNYHQALEMCKEEDIQIILADIEMPGYTGLDLYEEIRKTHSNIVCIFLTGFDRFAYCKKALELGSFDYLLKPVDIPELEQTLRKAIDEYRRKIRQFHFECFDEDLTKQISVENNPFWLNVINGRVSSDKKEFLEKAKKYGVDIDSACRYELVLFKIHQLDKMRKRDNLLTVLNSSKPMTGSIIASFTLLDLYSGIIVLHQVENEELYGNYYYSLLGGEFESISSGRVNAWELTDSCYEMMQILNNSIENMKKNFIYSCDKVLSTAEIMSQKEWNTIVSNRGFAELQNILFRKIDEHIAESIRIKNETIALMVYEFDSNCISFLNECDLDSSWISENEMGISKETFSINDYKNYIQSTITKITEKLKRINNYSDIIEKAKYYVNEHLYDDISRNDIAEYIGINAEYLSRLFSKKTGVSLVDYIAKEKMNMAVKLMYGKSTISEIATQLGYTNFAYFTQIFKKYHHDTPSNFRKKMIARE